VRGKIYSINCLNPQCRPLRNSNSNWSLGYKSILCTHLLGSATQTFHPPIHISPNTITIQFLQQDVVIYTIKGLCQVQNMAPTHCLVPTALSLVSRSHTILRTRRLLMFWLVHKLAMKDYPEPWITDMQQHI